MSVGEYLAIFASMILGLAVGDLAMSLHRMLRARDRIEWDWLNPAIACFVLVNLVATWWATFGWYSKASHVSVVGFLPDIILFVLMLLSAAAALPDEIPAEGLDLRDYYVSQSRYFWTLQICTLAMIIVFVGPRYVSGGWQAVAVGQRENIVLLALLAFLALSRRPWVHQLLVALLLVYTVWGYVDMSMEDIATRTHFSSAN